MFLMILLWIYVRLSFSEERDAKREFGAAYERYAAVTPRRMPHWGHRHAAAHPGA
jgi:protein-S-isoprenylcysteine O-methyltransferase Ste14